jgi:hypothetical protein
LKRNYLWGYVHLEKVEYHWTVLGKGSDFTTASRTDITSSLLSNGHGSSFLVGKAGLSVKLTLDGHPVRCFLMGRDV